MFLLALRKIPFKGIDDPFYSGGSLELEELRVSEVTSISPLDLGPLRLPSVFKQTRESRS